jgi:hypothetical protein
MTAFVPGPRCNVAGATDGPLAGLRFAVKDLIDIAGVPTGGGNPDWPRIYPTPSKNAWVVQRTWTFCGLRWRWRRHEEAHHGDAMVAMRSLWSGHSQVLRADQPGVVPSTPNRPGASMPRHGICLARLSR